jgi:DNA gyrase/topoisomerase IV subunit A
MELRLNQGIYVHKFGLGLSRPEKEWLMQEINDFLEILNSREKLINVLAEEFLKIKQDFATPRKTDIELNELEQLELEFNRIVNI